MRHLFSKIKFGFIVLLLISSIAVILTAVKVTYAGSSPDVRLVSVDRVYHNGGQLLITEKPAFVPEENVILLNYLPSQGRIN